MKHAVQELPCRSINLRPGSVPSHLRTGEKGWVKMTTLLNTKTKRDRNTRKKRSIALNEYIQAISLFLAQVNIEVSRGHLRSKFKEICNASFLRKCAIVSELNIGRRQRKKAL